MEIFLKYPVFVFRENDNMIYVFYDDNQMKTSNTEIFQRTKFGGRTIIDSSGRKYVTQSAYITRYWGVLEGMFRMKGKVISYEYTYKDAGSLITLDELKDLILNRFPKSRWFSSAWSSVKELRIEMDRCTTFKQLAFIFEKPSSKNIFQKIWK